MVLHRSIVHGEAKIQVQQRTDHLRTSLKAVLQAMFQLDCAVLFWRLVVLIETAVTMRELFEIYAPAVVRNKGPHPCLRSEM